MSVSSLKHFKAAAGFLAFICLASTGFAQNASLTGVVKDPQGGIVPNAIVSLVDLGKQVTIKTLTNQTGIYEFPILQPGQYELKTDAPGFQTSTVSPFPSRSISAAARMSSCPWVQHPARSKLLVPE